jgi:glycosyltransferase involved in cell wall biosynthesis
MSVYNDELNLENSIKSIINQTHKNFELIIINDGSNKKTKNILSKFKKNKKIRIFHNKKNFGLPYSLNKAIKKCKYDLIARMDSDDISYKNRIKHQLDFIKKNPKIDVLGSDAVIAYSDRETKYSNVEKNNISIKKKIFYLNPFFHSSVIFKKSIFNKIGFYNSYFKKCQDYDLWLRGRKKLYYSNIKKRLIKYHSKSGYKNITFFYTIMAIIKNVSFSKEVIVAIFAITYNIIIYFKKNSFFK